ncbi:MAG: phytanoyl-CoA dioxygenase family protein [Pseudomonadota bacterium]
MLEIKPEKLRSQFNQDGYVAIRPLFDKGKIAEIRAETTRFIRDVVPTMPDVRVYYEDKNDRTSLKQIQKMFEYDGYFAELMNEGVVRELAEILLKDDVKPINMQYFNKPAGMGRATPPHQDGYYFHLTPCEAVTGWLALDDVDEDNGCIHYVRGSHKADHFRPHGPTGILGFSQGITDFGNGDDHANAVAFPGSAGTFLMHHARTIHWAGPNHAKDRARRAIGFIYYAKHAREDAKTRDTYQQALDQQLRADAKI